MKIYVFILLVLLIIILPTNAAKVNLFKEAYSRGETLQAEVFSEDPLTANNISIYKDWENMDVGVFLIKINETSYFLYFDVPMGFSSGEYTIKILKSKKKLNVLPSLLDNVVLVDPAGFKYTKGIEPKFKFTLKNKGISSVEFNFMGNPFIFTPQTIIVSPDFAKNVQFSFDPQTITSPKLYFTISYTGGSYKIPVYFDISKEISYDLLFYYNNSVINKLETDLYFDLPSEGILTIENKGEDIRDVDLSITGELDNILRLETISFDLFKKGETFLEKLYVNENMNAQQKSYTGDLVITSNKKIINKFPVVFNLLAYEQKTNVTKNETKSMLNQTNRTFVKKEAPKVEKEPSSILFKLGIFLVIILIVFVIIFILVRRKKERKEFYEFSEYVGGLKENY